MATRLFRKSLDLSINSILSIIMWKTKNPCGVCKKGVTGRTGGIQCEGHCQQWFHPNCINVNSQEYVDLGNSSLIWICNTCGMHNIGMTSSIGNISSLHTDNSFDILGPDSEEENEDANKTSYSDIGSPIHTSLPRRQTLKPKSKKNFRSIKILNVNCQSIRAKNRHFIF